MKILTFAAAAVSLSASAAFGGGLVTSVGEQPIFVGPGVVATVSPSTWAGAYVGGNLSYGRADIDAENTLALQTDALSIGRTLFSPDGVTGAVRGGYDWQRNQLVFGVGAEYNISDISGGLEDDATAETLGRPEANISSVARVFGRMGYTYGAWLPYALLGYSTATLEISGPDGGEGDIDGVTAGLGVERYFMNNLSGYAEYSFTNFGNVAGAEDQLSIEINEVKLGVNFRF